MRVNSSQGILANSTTIVLVACLGWPRATWFCYGKSRIVERLGSTIASFQASGASMQRILSILRAAHCRSTHHYFAIDALQQLKTAQAQRLANILLKYHDDYLVGAKAPDSDFKDFQNHVHFLRISVFCFFSKCSSLNQVVLCEGHGTE